jgi:hypothetical protein
MDDPKVSVRDTAMLRRAFLLIWFRVCADAHRRLAANKECAHCMRKVRVKHHVIHASLAVDLPK